MRNDSLLRRLPRLALLALFMLGAAACSDDTPLQPGADDGGNRPAPEGRALGLMEITISGVGTPEMSASAVPVLPGGSPSHGVPITAGEPGLSLGLTPAGGDPSGGIQLEPYSTGSFTNGTRGDGGVRYVHATFRVRNAATDGNAYNTQRKNLTFLAASTGSTINGTAISSMRRFDGSPAGDAIAPQVMPTGAVKRAPGSDGIITGPDVLQVFEESELTRIPVAPGVELLPYGFVARHVTSTTTRTLPASPAAGRFDGLVTFTFKIPLQATPAEDPFMVSAIFLAVDDSETRITQSLEEQTPEGTAAFLARAQALGATMKTVLPGGGGLLGDPNRTRMVCTVRTAGPSTSPVATMITVAGLSVVPTDDWPIWYGGRIGRHAFAFEVRDGNGNLLTDLPIEIGFSPPAVVRVGSDGLWRPVPRRERASTSVTATVCGRTSAPVIMRTSGYSPLAAALHSLAIRTNGTVEVWGQNHWGQADVPAGLTNVVQVSAGTEHSLALRANGTVVAWGGNNSSQTIVPSGLTNVIQIAAGGNHSLALKHDGTVVAWGWNNSGQSTVPSGLTDVVQIAAGAEHSLALRANGTVVAWGNNQSGQTTVPSGLANVVQVAAGTNHSLALKVDGTVVTWGYDMVAQADMPSDLANVVQVAAGAIHSLALKADGTVVAWGDRTNWFNSGQIDVPPELTDVVQVAAGFFHSLALRADGTVVAWGGSYDMPSSLVAAVP